MIYFSIKKTMNKTIMDLLNSMDIYHYIDIYNNEIHH